MDSSSQASTWTRSSALCLLQCSLITKTPLGLASPTPSPWFRFLSPSALTHLTTDSLPAYHLFPPPDRSFERTGSWSVLPTLNSQLGDLRLSILSIWGNEQVDIRHFRHSHLLGKKQKVGEEEHMASVVERSERTTALSSPSMSQWHPSLTCPRECTEASQSPRTRRLPASCSPKSL